MIEPPDLRSLDSAARDALILAQAEMTAALTQRIAELGSKLGLPPRTPDIRARRRARGQSRRISLAPRVITPHLDRWQPRQGVSATMQQRRGRGTMSGTELRLRPQVARWANMGARDGQYLSYRFLRAMLTRHRRHLPTARRKRQSHNQTYRRRWLGSRKLFESSDRACHDRRDKSECRAMQAIEGLTASFDQD
jgi:hypothetical protein